MPASPDSTKSLSWHHEPQNFSDKFALKFVKFLRFCADSFFAKRYGHRAIVLETVAAVPCNTYDLCGVWRTMEA
jgi:ubiquinol oxidase